MFDIKTIRDNPQAFDAALKRRGLEPLSAKLIALDEARRANLTTLQDAQSRRNAVSKDIGKAKGAKDEALAAKLMAEVASLKDIIAKGEEQERADNSAVEAALAVIPNLPLAEVPDGKDEKDNKEVRRWGEPNKPVESPKQHFELGEALGLMDFEAAQKISGARFVVLKGALSRLERAIAALMLDMHTAPVNGNLGGYTEHQVPLLVRDARRLRHRQPAEVRGGFVSDRSELRQIIDAVTKRLSKRHLENYVALGRQDRQSRLEGLVETSDSASGLPSHN